jgi:hypothetical protein
MEEENSELRFSRQSASDASKTPKYHTLQMSEKTQGNVKHLLFDMTKIKTKKVAACKPKCLHQYPFRCVSSKQPSFSLAGPNTTLLRLMVSSGKHNTNVNLKIALN